MIIDQQRLTSQQMLDNILRLHPDLDRQVQEVKVEHKRELQMERLEHERMTRQMEALLHENERNAECSICMDARKTHVLVPCGHQCVCETCIDIGDACPMCLVTVTSKIKVFY